VLSSFFPANVGEIDAALAAQEADAPTTGAGHNSDDFEEAAAMGADVGRRFWRTPRETRLVWPTPARRPIGDGYWKWSGGPIVRGNYHARPFFLASGDEFRPAHHRRSGHRSTSPRWRGCARSPTRGRRNNWRLPSTGT
jgi:hypothetical protein